MRTAETTLAGMKGIGANFSAGTPLSPPPTVTLTLTGEPSDQDGEVVLAYEYATHIVKGQSDDSIGDLTSETGLTSFDASFKLNGNYGTASFYGSVDGETSDAKIVIVTGQTYEQLESEIDAYIAEIKREWENAKAEAIRSATLFGLVATVMIALVPAIMKMGPIEAVIGIVIAAIVLSISAEKISEAFSVWGQADRALYTVETFRNEVQPYLDEMPKAK